MRGRDPVNHRQWRNVRDRTRELGGSPRLRRAEQERDIEYLIAALTDPGSRRAAVVSLGTLAEPSAARPVERLLQASDWRVRADAAVALGHIGDPGSAALLAELAREDESAFVRFDAVGALHELDEPAVVDALAAALEDGSATVRRRAAAELAERGDPRGTAELRAQRDPWRPRTLDLGRWAREPRVTLPLWIAVPLAAGWLVAASLAVQELAGPAVAVVALAAIFGFNELWLRLREREAWKRGIYRIPPDVQVGGGAVLAEVVLPIAIVVVQLLFGGDSVYGLVPLNLFFLTRRVFVETAERCTPRFMAFLASHPRRRSR